jgi:hypothetical protein
MCTAMSNEQDCGNDCCQLRVIPVMCLSQGCRSRQTGIKKPVQNSLTLHPEDRTRKCIRVQSIAPRAKMSTRIVTKCKAVVMPIVRAFVQHASDVTTLRVVFRN